MTITKIEFDFKVFLFVLKSVKYEFLDFFASDGMFQMETGVPFL